MRIIITVILAIFLLEACKSSQPQVVVAAETPQEIEVEVAAIEIIEPEFEVVSICILQADIVVTEFEGIVKITNPNDFALELTNLTYALYGNGALWTNGNGIGALHVPALSSAETRFIFEMNFINMNRRLLDDVIAMRRINYHFKGEAQVQPVIPSVAAFHMSYDYVGLSEVKRKAN